MDANERIKQVRQSLGLSQAKFAKDIAISNGYIAGIELGNRKSNDRIVKLICSTYNVNEQWLRTGEGDMFIESDDSMLSEVAAKYHLSPLEKTMIQSFLALSLENRKGVIAYAKELITSVMENYDAHKDEIPPSW